ncbi:anti-sigma F factor antagonist [Anoxybacter fermentans]|uniref:Anti-sigma F factor antagonist n=1 Tax=Anoxybacter fermentans TaxID=1323375 RepID=A0A3Q9HP78_9FIRM|nr:anti-sigma F factor antagonist [Anoxybacter fermentans]AZR72293.1 anti-sigma F factor antagonist [Anoxybacter fermentans]
MELHIKKKKDTLIVQIKGELDLHTADDLRQGIDQYLQKYPSLKNLILDLKGIEFIDSSGLGVILGRYKTIKQRGGNLAAVAVSPRVRRIFELSGMLKIIRIYENKAEAETAFDLL